MIEGIDKLKDTVARYTTLTIFEVDDIYYHEFIDIYDALMRDMLEQLIDRPLGKQMKNQQINGFVK